MRERRVKILLNMSKKSKKNINNSFWIYRIVIILRPQRGVLDQSRETISYD